MSFKEFIDKRSTHIVMTIVALNVVMWFSWMVMKPSHKEGKRDRIALSRENATQDSLINFLMQEDKAEKAQRDAADAIVPAPRDTVVIVQKTTENSYQFILDNLVTLVSVFSAIPVVILKWEQAIHKIRGMHKKSRKKK